MNDHSGREQVELADNRRTESSELEFLDAIATREAENRRQQYAKEKELHHLLTRTLVEAIPEAVVTLGRLHDALALTAEEARYTLADPAIAHQQRLLNSHLSSSGGLLIEGAPFDFEWRARKDFGSPDADRTTGDMELSVWSGATPSNVESTWNGAGIGVSFRPRARSTYVRVAPYLRYGYEWKNDSTLEVARNRGELGVLVREVGSGIIIVDNRVRLWNDGTSWYQTHSDEQDDVFSGSTYFFASSDHEYDVWFWFNSSIDFNHTTSGFLDFGSSQASNSLFARLVFVVFEQWT